MPWSIVGFSRHKGKTLPQIIFSDPDWFFWAFEKEVFKNKGSLDTEAHEVHRKARRIRIPNNDNGGLVIEYIFQESTGTFSHFSTENFSHFKVVPSSSRPSGKKYIDMSVPRQTAHYDKLGYRYLLSSLKYHVFRNKSVRMTKKKCEDFFDDSSNFI